MFDPFFPLNENMGEQPLDEIPPLDGIFVSHGHFDHIAGIPAVCKRYGEKVGVYCTRTPRDTLVTKGMDSGRIYQISPGDVISMGDLEIQVLKGKHIKFDFWQIARTLLNPRMIAYRKNLRYILKENAVCAESGETVVYNIQAGGKQVLLLGSANLDAETKYTKGADMLILPFQGRSDIEKYAMQIISRLLPKQVLLSHFDDSYPPITSSVNTEPFRLLMRKTYPDIAVLIPQINTEWINLEEHNTIVS